MKTTVRPDFVFADDTLNRLDFPGKQVITLTCHRRENYGAPMEAILTAVRTIVEQNSNVEVVYPRPPEPRGPGLRPPPPGGPPRIHLIAPLDVAQMHNLMARSYLVLTDSGGLQEEASPPWANPSWSSAGRRNAQRPLPQARQNWPGWKQIASCPSPRSRSRGERLMPEWHMR